MRKSHTIEIIVLVSAGISGVIINMIPKWYIGFLVGGLLFFGCSHLVSWLKEQTLKEYIEAVRKTKQKGTGQ